MLKEIWRWRGFPILQNEFHGNRHEAANEIAKSIADEMTVLDALGPLNMNGVPGSWQTESQVLDDGPVGATPPATSAGLDARSTCGAKRSGHRSPRASA